MTTNQDKINEMREQIQCYFNKDHLTVDDFENISFLMQECLKLEREQVANMTAMLKNYYNV